jgi:NAD(P)-dependent dehydrogenase (short-subunit alcohol dehydrogenase family)
MSKHGSCSYIHWEITPSYDIIAVVGLTRGDSSTFADKGIRINVVCPGSVTMLVEFESLVQADTDFQELLILRCLAERDTFLWNTAKSSRL